MNDSAPKIGLALGGGATLGAAHIGVIKALEKQSLDIHCIAGTSIGAYIAALYAFGQSPAEMEKAITGLDWLDISSFSFLKMKLGLLSNDKLGGSVRQIIGDVDIEDAEIPLAIVATDISRCEKVVLQKGDAGLAVMASACLPGIFCPVEIGEHILVDGGLVENVPVSPLEKLGADAIIAVDLSTGRDYQAPDDLVDVLINSIDVAIDNATRIQTEQADLVIAPDLSAFSRTETGATKRLIEAGYTSGLKSLRDAALG